MGWVEKAWCKIFDKWEEDDSPVMWMARFVMMLVMLLMFMPKWPCNGLRNLRMSVGSVPISRTQASL